MFGLGGIATGILLLVVLASFGVAMVIALVLTLILKICGLRFERAFAWGFGIPVLFFAASWAYAASLAPDRPQPKELPVEIPLPEDWDKP